MDGAMAKIYVYEVLRVRDDMRNAGRPIGCRGGVAQYTVSTGWRNSIYVEIVSCSCEDWQRGRIRSPSQQI